MYILIKICTVKKHGKLVEDLKDLIVEYRLKCSELKRNYNEMLF